DLSQLFGRLSASSRAVAIELRAKSLYFSFPARERQVEGFGCGSLLRQFLAREPLAVDLMQIERADGIGPLIGVGRREREQLSEVDAGNFAALVSLAPIGQLLQRLGTAR